MQHGVSQHGGFGSRESAKNDRHEPGGNLIVRNFAIGVSTNQVFDFRGRQFVPVALLADYVDGANGFLSLAHLRRNPSGRSSVMWLSFQPLEVWKNTVASGPNSKITWRQ